MSVNACCISGGGGGGGGGAQSALHGYEYALKRLGRKQEEHIQWQHL